MRRPFAAPQTCCVLHEGCKWHHPEKARAHRESLLYACLPAPAPLTPELDMRVLPLPAYARTAAWLAWCRGALAQLHLARDALDVSTPSSLHEWPSWKQQSGRRCAQTPPAGAQVCTAKS
eukprot:351491-Chlamydomonas_euryale.AAC.3